MSIEFEKNNENIIDGEMRDGKIYVKDKKRNGKRMAKFTAAALAFGLLAGTGYQAVNIGSNYINYTASSEVSSTSGTVAELISTSAVSEDSSASVLTYDVSDVVTAAMPSIVAINCTSVVETTSSYGNMMPGRGNGQQQITEEEVTSCGSGVIIGTCDEGIYVVTNYHVIEDTTSVAATFNDESEAACEVVGYDESADLAVLLIPYDNISEDTMSNIAVISFASSDDVKVGETAIAIGNALGYGQSVTTGVVSAVDREVELEEGTRTLIQTDAAINPGNSGGALLNASGELIGINTVKFSSEEVEGMGYAIPASEVASVVMSIINADN